MEAVLLIARLILAGVFGIAGVAKLKDLAGSEKAILGFGVPESLAKPFAVILPLAEIAVAVLLLPLSTVWFGAVGALALLMVFIGGIAYQMSQGNAPDCHCFGQIHSEPVGWSTLIRNSILAAIAAFVVFAGRETPGASAFAWLADLSAGDRIGLFFGAAISVLLFVILTTARQIVRNQILIQRQIEVLELSANLEGGGRVIETEQAAPPPEGLPIGAIAPDFALPAISGKTLALKDLLAGGKPFVMFFVSPTCKPCQRLLPEIKKWADEFKGKLDFVFVSSGEIAENREKFGADSIVLLQKDREIRDLYQATWTPTAILVNADGRIGSRPAAGDGAIRETVEAVTPVLNASNGHKPDNLYVTKLDPHSRTPRIYSPAPKFTLPDLNGKSVSLTDFRGRQIFLLFWNPTCQFCEGMIDDLKNWEANPKGTELLIINEENHEIVREQNFKATVLLENYGEVQSLYGAVEIGTPSGYLIDAAGRIVSENAIGADAVLALLGQPKKSPAIAAGHNHRHN